MIQVRNVPDDIHRTLKSGADAACVALAEVLDAPLLTRDQRLANATAHTAPIEVI